MIKLEGKCNTQYASVAVVIALLLLSEARGEHDKPERIALLELYEDALVNDDSSLYTLREIYFNPSPKYTYSSSFCLRVLVTVDGIQNPHSASGYCDAAFDYFTSYYFRTYCLLELLRDDGGASKLSELLSVSNSAEMFYVFDPTFYSIMQALAKSMVIIEFENYDYYNDNQYYINIDIDEELDDMPCWEDAVYALRMSLVWVSTSGNHFEVSNSCMHARCYNYYQGLIESPKAVRGHVTHV